MIASATPVFSYEIPFPPSAYLLIGAIALGLGWMIYAGVTLAVKGNRFATNADFLVIFAVLIVAIPSAFASTIATAKQYGERDKALATWIDENYGVKPSDRNLLSRLTTDADPRSGVEFERLDIRLEPHGENSWILVGEDAPAVQDPSSVEKPEPTPAPTPSAWLDLKAPIPKD